MKKTILAAFVAVLTLCTSNSVQAAPSANEIYSQMNLCGRFQASVMMGYHLKDKRVPNSMVMEKFEHEPLVILGYVQTSLKDAIDLSVKIFLECSQTQKDRL